MEAITTRIDSFDWAVGLFEGEGYIGLHENGTDGYTRIQMALSSTDKETINRFYAVVKIGHCYGPYAKKGNRKDIYSWICARACDVHELASMMMPMLGERRQAQARAVLDHPVATRKRGFCARGLHRMEGHNLYVTSDGKRRCRTCRNTQAKIRRKQIADAKKRGCANLDRNMETLGFRRISGSEMAPEQFEAIS